MIRLVLASLIPAGVALAAAFLVGPSAISLPRGEPILVASQERMAALQAVDHDGCAPKLLTGAVPASEDNPASLRIVRLNDKPEQVAVTDMPIDAPPGTHLLLVIDRDGRLVAAGNRSASPQADGPLPQCPRTSEQQAEPGII